METWGDRTRAQSAFWRALGSFVDRLPAGPHVRAQIPAHWRHHQFARPDASGLSEGDSLLTCTQCGAALRNWRHIDYYKRHSSNEK